MKAMTYTEADSSFLEWLALSLSSGTRVFFACSASGNFLWRRMKSAISSRNSPDGGMLASRWPAVVSQFEQILEHREAAFSVGDLERLHEAEPIALASEGPF